MEDVVVEMYLAGLSKKQSVKIPQERLDEFLKMVRKPKKNEANWFEMEKKKEKKRAVGKNYVRYWVKDVDAIDTSRIVSFSLKDAPAKK